MDNFIAFIEENRADIVAFFKALVKFFTTIFDIELPEADVEA